MRVAGYRRVVPPLRSLVRVLRLNRLFPRRPRFQSFGLSRDPLPDQSIEVEAISDAFMLVRRSAAGVARCGRFGIHRRSSRPPLATRPV